MHYINRARCADVAVRRFRRWVSSRSRMSKAARQGERYWSGHACSPRSSRGLRLRRPAALLAAVCVAAAGLAVAATTPAGAQTSQLGLVGVNYYSATVDSGSYTLSSIYYVRVDEVSDEVIGSCTQATASSTNSNHFDITGLQPATTYAYYFWTNATTCPTTSNTEALTFTTAGMIFSPNPAAATEQSTNAAPANSYTVALSSKPSADVTVTVAGTNLDLDPDSDNDDKTLTFTASNWSTGQTVQILAKSDPDADDELIDISHTPASSDASYQHVASTYNAVMNLPLNVTDNDLGLFGEMVTATDATLRISQHAGNWWYKQVVPAGGDCSEPIRAGRTTTPVTGLTPGTDYTFKAYSDSACTTELTELTSDERDANFTTKKIILSTPRLIVPEEGRASYTVRLGVAPLLPVTVSVATSSSSDADITANLSSLTFTTSNWDTAQTVVLSAADDTDTAYGTAIVEHTADSTYGPEPASVVEALEGDNDACNDTNAVNGLDAGDLVDDCNTLLAAEVMLAGPAGATSPLDWDTTLAIQSWTGVTVSQGRVTSLDLSDESLEGHIPNTLGDLPLLTSIDLSRNVLQGPIPARLSRLTGLTDLNLSYNYLSRPLPAPFTTLTGITALNLSYNRFEGPIPSALGDFSGLTSLDLSHNSFKGSMSPEDNQLFANLGRHSKLTRLNISYNELTGSIPAQIGNLTQLTFFSASSNQLAGSLPTALGNLTRLTTLDLSNNKLGDRRPREPWYKWISDPPDPYEPYWELQPCDLSKKEGKTCDPDPVPEQIRRKIPAQMGNLTNLTQLRLFNNRLSGCVPPNLVSFLGANEINTQKVEVPPGSGIYNDTSIAACPGIATSKVTVDVVEGSTATYTVRLSTVPTTPVTVTVSVDGDDDITADTDTTTPGNQNELTFTATNWAAPQTVTLAAASDSDSTNGTATVTNTTTSADNSYSNTTSTVIATEIDGESGAELTAGAITATGATLSIAGHSGIWYIKQTSPTSGDCSTPIGAGTSSVTLANLVPGTPYTYYAFSDSYCAIPLASVSFNTSGIALSTTRIIVPEEGTAAYTVRLASAPTASVTVTVAAVGDTDITVDTDSRQTGDQSTLTFTTANWSTAQTVMLAAADDTSNVHGTATVTHTGASDDSSFEGTTSTLIATEGDNDICQRNPAVGGVDVASGGLVDDCNTLLAAKAMLAGTSDALDDWSAGTAIADWTGVTVTDGRVSGLGLTNQGLNGMIPNTLGDLSELTVLRLNSSFVPAIPNISAPANPNSLTGSIPAQLGSLTKLIHLFLDGNSLSGSIPEELGNMSALASLALNDNNLTGSMPVSLGKLTELRLFNLSANSLSGSIPSKLGDLSKILTFNLSGNQLTGSIPEEIGRLTEAVSFDLSDNKLTGAMPASLGKLTKAAIFSLDGNNLSGSIPASFGSLTSLILLNLSDNSLSGSIPQELGNLTQLIGLNLYGNNLSGCVPRGLSRFVSPYMVNPQDGGVNLSTCGGSSLSVSFVSDKGALLNLSDYTGLWWYKKSAPGSGSCSTLPVPGGVPAVLVGLTEATTYTYRAYADPLCTDELASVTFSTSGVLLSAESLIVHEGVNASYTVRLGTAPSNTVEVVLTVGETDDRDISFDAKATTHIKTLTFTTSNWSTLQTVTVWAAEDEDAEYGEATITHTSTSRDAHTSDFYANTSTDLKVYEADHNVCPGSIAVGGADVTRGGLVDDCNALLAAEATLAGTSTAALNWDAGLAMSAWTGITVADGRVTAISLAQQTLRGMIPNNLSEVRNLVQLDFSNNSLTGPIPPEIGQLGRLGTFWVPNNTLSGPVPETIGNLASLTGLRLGGNNLSGALPASLGRLSMLTGLGLSGNSFSSSIPAELGKLTDLTLLDLSESGVSGLLPVELSRLTNLQTLKLGENSLWDTIPKEFGNLTSLTWLELGGNNLSGPIPASLGDLSDLFWLDLSKNSLSGEIPESLGGLPDIAVMALHSNELSGCSPANLLHFLTPTTLTADSQINPQKNGVVIESCPGMVLSDMSIVVAEDDSTTYTVRLATQPTKSVQIKIAATGDSDITLDTDSTADGDQDTVTFTTANWAVPQTVTVSAAEDDDTDNGKATIRNTLISLDADYNNVTVAIAAMESDNDPRLSASSISWSSAILKFEAILTIKNHSGPWFHKRTAPSTGGCVAAQPLPNSFQISRKATLTELNPSTTYIYKAYADSECTTELTTDDTHARFTTPQRPETAAPPLPPAPAPPGPRDYFDDDNGSVFEGFINRLAVEGITVGCNRAGNLYCPSRSVTRAQMAVFIQRALKPPVPSAPSGYTDAQGFGRDAIAALSAEGITVGCNAAGTLFCPDRPIRRDEMAAFLARARKLPTPDRPPAFEDVADNFFKNHIAAIALADITVGCNASGTLFCPDQFVRRDEMAAFLVRAFIPLNEVT